MKDGRHAIPTLLCFNRLLFVRSSCCCSSFPIFFALIYVLPFFFFWSGVFPCECERGLFSLKQYKLSRKPFGSSHKRLRFSLKFRVVFQNQTNFFFLTLYVISSCGAHAYTYIHVCDAVLEQLFRRLFGQGLTVPRPIFSGSRHFLVSFQTVHSNFIRLCRCRLSRPID